MTADKAKLFIDGKSQAVRLPKKFRFDSQQVYIWKEGEQVILSAQQPSWDAFFDEPSAFTEEFLLVREDMQPQPRQFF
jgi:antitoxin VapB